MLTFHIFYFSKRKPRRGLELGNLKNLISLWPLCYKHLQICEIRNYNSLNIVGNPTIFLDFARAISDTVTFLAYEAFHLSSRCDEDRIIISPPHWADFQSSLPRFDPNFTISILSLHLSSFFQLGCDLVWKAVNPTIRSFRTTSAGESIIDIEFDNNSCKNWNSAENLLELGFIKI